MKNLLLVLAVMICLSALLSGCGMTDSYQERVWRYKQIDDLESRMFVDDWDYFWLRERATYLSEYYPHVGG